MDHSTFKASFPLYSVSGSLVLLLQQKLTESNIQTFNSDIVFAVAKKYVKENKLVPGEQVIIKSSNPDRYSLQYRWNCPESGAVVAFQQEPWSQSEKDKDKRSESKTDSLEGCLYIFSNMVFRSSAEALKEVRKHIDVVKIPQCIRLKEVIVVII